MINLDKYSGIKLDVGCGANKQPGWVGMDMLPLDGVDIVHDLLDIPWPLEDESVLAAMTSHVMEHVPKTQVILDDGKFKTIHPFIMVMDEVWRVMKPDGHFMIAVPHGASPGFLQDPTHTSQVNENTFAYFDPEAFDGLLYNFYKPKPWKIKVDGRGEPQIFFDPSGNVEVVLIKRRDDS